MRWYTGNRSTVASGMRLGEEGVGGSTLIASDGTEGLARDTKPTLQPTTADTCR
jgi:hypothetical protein